MLDGDERDFYQAGMNEAILKWCKESVIEGEAVLRADPAWAGADESISYVMGDQPTGKTREADVRRVVVNETKKAILEHASALTDVKPLFTFRTRNEANRGASEVLNQYAVIWWVNTMADLTVLETALYALTTGAGDTVIEFDPGYRGGETRISARDWRNTIPIGAVDGADPQTWDGVTFRETWSVSRLKAKWPDKAHLFKPDTGDLPVASGLLKPFESVFGRTPTPATTQAPSTLTGLGSKDPNRARKAQFQIPVTTFYRTYLNDRSKNLLTEPVLMGKPGTNYSYLVAPGDPLYPNKRLILWSEHGIVADGPSPYWHGNYPLSRLRLQPWPWLFIGLSLMHDLRPMQDAINWVTNDLLSLLGQITKRGSLWDKQMPKSVRARFNPERPNWKLQRPNQFSDGFKFTETPNVPAWAFNFFERMFDKFSDLAGTANLRALLQLRQAPGRETVEKFIEALTPQMRLEGRQIERYLRDLAIPVKSNFFQFQSKPRIFQALGDQAGELKDLDYDPDTMIPALNQGDPGYTPELDARRGRHERARFFTKMFSFYVSPSSLLALNAMEKKLLYLQLSRQGFMDPWTLWDILEVPNAGSPPVMMLPITDQDAIRKATEAGQPIPQEPRMPRTITERLMAAQALGIGQQVSPVGRKATAQQPPQVKERSDGSTAVSESG